MNLKWKAIRTISVIMELSERTTNGIDQRDHLVSEHELRGKQFID